MSWTPAGHDGGAVHFNGSGWVTVADHADLDLRSTMTIEAWVKPRSHKGWETVVMKEAPPRTESYALYATGGTGYNANAWVGPRGIDPPGNTPLNVWTHVAFTLDNGTGRLYRNGALVSQRTGMGQAIPTNGALRVGGNSIWLNEGFIGVIDDVRVYSDVLTASEIASHVPGAGAQTAQVETSSRVPQALEARQASRRERALQQAVAPGLYAGGMKAVACQHAELSVVDRDTPVPGTGQLLIEVTRAGICGSDLHARHHCDELADVMVETGYEDFMRSNQAITFGHEFTGRIAEHGPGCRKTAPAGAPVVAVPLIRRGSEVHAVGLSALAPGAYAEQMLVEESLAFPVPNGLAPDHAALTEPMAVGLHAVRRGEVKKGDVAIVIGCGPVGLSVILHLKARGVRKVVASDFSPARRALAQECGADFVIDPAAESPYETDASAGHLDSIPGALEKAANVVEKAHRLRLPWWHVWRAADAVGLKPKRPVVFECVGVPGVIDEIIAKAPLFTRVVVVGVCMGADQIRPSMAINKEIDLRFVVGYSPAEYRESLHKLAEGEVDATPLITGTVGLEGVDGAFGALGDPESHAKILIDPQREGAEISS